MEELIKQEQFEIEVLDYLNSKRILKDLVFCGGTMLRLCYGLNRYSVDLDFWITQRINTGVLFTRMKGCLEERYDMLDYADKLRTLLIEVRSVNYPRGLKIEVRKEVKVVNTEMNIAYSPHSNIQVPVRTVSLRDMMEAKIEAFLARGEIRDVFDIEFLVKKGIELPESRERLRKVLERIEKLKRVDYTVKLGSILEARDRRYYTEKNFSILKMEIQEKLRVNPE